MGQGGVAQHFLTKARNFVLTLRAGHLRIMGVRLEPAFAFPTGAFTKEGTMKACVIGSVYF